MGDTYDFSRARIEGSTINIQSTIQQQLAAVQALHQLPSPPADFAGRGTELAELEAAMGDGGAAISGLRGMGGVGKTALALVLAEGLCDRYSDAQIYLDLQGTSPEPLTPADAMAHVIRAFQPELRLPDNQTELASLYRSLLHGKRVLLLMDNAASRAQVEPLIPPPGCALLVTSRRRFALPGLHALNLDALPELDAQGLLLRIAPRIEPAVGELARLCGCLPLALRVAASALAEREDLPVDTYLDRLRRGRERLDEVDASLSLSYDLLPESLQHLWRLLAAFPGTFDQPAAAAVWDAEPDDAQDALSELVRYSLVEWREDSGRHTLHELARAFARRHQTEDEQDQSVRRHASHYVQVLAAADQLYLQGGEALLAGLRLFDLEWHNIEAGQAWAVASPDDPDRSALCPAYATAGPNCLALRHSPPERMCWLLPALSVVRGTGDRLGEANCIKSLGDVHMALAEYGAARERYEEARPVYAAIQDRLGEANCIKSLGDVHRMLDDYGAARERYEEARPVYAAIGDRLGEAFTSWNLGLTYEDTDLARAAELMQVCVDFERDIGHPDTEADAARVAALRQRIDSGNPQTD